MMHLLHILEHYKLAKYNNLEIVYFLSQIESRYWRKEVDNPCYMALQIFIRRYK